MKDWRVFGEKKRYASLDIVRSLLPLIKENQVTLHDLYIYNINRLDQHREMLVQCLYFYSRTENNP